MTQTPSQRGTPAVTKGGRRVDWFVEKQIADVVWREQLIPPEVSGLTRPITVLRGRKSSDFIAHDWHGDEKTFCPPMWWDLVIGSGACNLGCRACFLILTHRVMRDPWRHLLYDNGDDFYRAAQKWLADPARRRQHTLGVGIDRSDSLLYEGVTPHARTLAPLFASPTANPMGNKLVLLTKSQNTRYLADIAPEHRKNVLVTFSLNPEDIAALWEGVWPDGEPIPPTIEQRLAAARFAQDLGFEVRVRVDPIMTPPGWEESYAAFFDRVKALGIRFRYYTLGTYREKNTQLQQWASYWGMAPMDWQPDEGDMAQDGTHRHLAEGKRVQIYRTVRDRILRADPLARISLCKETHVVRKLVGLCNADCNCLI